MSGNRLLTSEEFEERCHQAVVRCAEDRGVTTDEFYEIMRQEWNDAIARDEEE